MVKTSQNQPVKKKRNTRGMGSIRQKNGGYEGRITIKVNGKSKQISLFNKDKRNLVQEMKKAKQEANENEYVEKDKITLEQAKSQIEEKNIETLNRTIMQLKIKRGNNGNHIGY